jgi:MFS family permease
MRGEAGYRRLVDAGGPLTQLVSAYRALAAVFANPSLRRVQLAWAGMSFATWSYVIGLGVYAFGVGGATAVGLVALVRLLPGALAAPFGGVLVDRRSRRDVLIASSLASAAALAGSAAAGAMGTPPAVVFVLAGLFTVLTSAYIPAQNALLPIVAKTPQELAAANVTHSAMDNVGFLSGSILAGILLATGSPQLVFAVAALVGTLAAFALSGVAADRRPVYRQDPELAGAMRQTALGFRTLWSDRALRLLGGKLTVLVFFEGAADVLAVLVALQLLGLGQAAVGYLNAAWGIGALIGGAGLAVLLHRGRLAIGLVAGSLIAGAGLALPGAWPIALAAYAAWILMGAGYTFVEVVAHTLLQRLGSDEVLGRVLGFLETSRFAAMALGSIAAPALVALLGIRATLVALGAVLPLFAFLRWGPLRRFEAGAPVEERPYCLLRENAIFAPLPVATLERLCHSLTPIQAMTGEDIITQGEPGSRFYMIDRGEVEIRRDGVIRHVEGDGGCFGEIALLREVPRTATVTATRPTRLVALDRDRFIGAVTGHVRSHQAADAVIEARSSVARSGG